MGEILSQRQLDYRARPVAFDLVVLGISLSGVTLPPEPPVPLSAPGGPPERSAMSTPALQGAVSRTPCSPIPGVGKLEWLEYSLL